jgi:hypothetical protein
MTNLVRNRDVTSDPSKHPTQFAAHTRSEPAETGLGKLLGESPEWVNGGQGTKLTIVESPVSDRERNYWVELQPYGYLNVNPTEFGIFDPDGPAYSGDRDSLYIGTENYALDGRLQVQYVAADSDMEFMESVEDLDDEQLQELETAVLHALRTEFGDDVDVEFTTSVERWADVSVMYNRVFTDENAVHEFDEKTGNVAFYTSNVMATLEQDEKYRALRDGDGIQVIRDVLRDRGLY